MAAADDVNALAFGDLPPETRFLSNSTVSMLLAKVASQKYGDNKSKPKVFEQASEYAARFAGAVDLTDVAAVDELFTALTNLEFVRETTADDGTVSVTKQKLHSYQVRSAPGLLIAGSAYAGCLLLSPLSAVAPVLALQIVALSNLNPPSVEVARSLIPSLEVLSDDEIGEALAILRRASARGAELDFGAAAGGAGAGF